MPNKLVNMQIKEVSAVDKAANGRKFIIMKRDGPEGGEVKKMSDESIKDKLFNFVKGMFGDDDSAKDLNQVLLERNADEIMWDLTSAFRESVCSIIGDTSVTDKKTAVLNSLNQLFGALVDTGIVKSGKKISATRIETLKSIHDQLGGLISGAELNNEGDGKVAKNDVEFLKGHPAGCMCQDCITKRDVLAKSAASAGASEEIVKRMETLEKRNQELEEQVKKSADESKTKEFITKAAGFSHLGIKADELGPVLKTISDTNPEGYAKVEETLRAANEQVAKGALFAESGTDATGITEITKRVDSMAQEIMKRDGCTIEKARTKVYQENPELYTEYQKETFGGDR